MKISFRILISVAVLMSTVKDSRAQDPHFSQFYAAQLYLNPAFAGSSAGSRLMANYRHQWAGIPGAFVTYAFSYDHNFSRLNSGLGLFLFRIRRVVEGCELRFLDCNTRII